MSITKILSAVILLTKLMSLHASAKEMRSERELRALVEREVPEHSEQLRAIWERDDTLSTILSMDEVRDWAGLEPGAITVSKDCVEGKGSLTLPVDIETGHYLRIENNFLSGHHDGFRNMMCMGIEVEDFCTYRALRFSCKGNLTGKPAFLFRIYDRTGGWLDWSIPIDMLDETWQTVTLRVPSNAFDLVDLRRIGGVMFELKASRASVSGTLWLDHIERIEGCSDGLEANEHTVPDTSYSVHPAPLNIPEAYASKPVEFVLNLSPLELPVWENDHETAMRCLAEELERFRNLKYLTVFINPGTRKPIHENSDYLPNLQELLVKMSKFLESQEIPFYQNVGVEGFGFYPLELIAAVERAAPSMFRGVLFGECSIETNGHVDYLIELMDFLAPKGKKVLYFQQTSYWIGVMQHHDGEPALFLKTLQNPKYRDVFVPMWENLLPATQGLCFGSTMGFWRGGLTSDWGVSAQSWGYANLNLGGTADMPGHWWIRMLLHVISTGGRFVEIEPIWPFDGENTEGQVRHSKQWAHTMRWIGDTRSQLVCDLHPGEELRALRFVDRLLSAGILRTPHRPEHLKSLPEVTLKVIDQDMPSDTRYKWGIFRRALDDNWWTLGDCPNSWEMALQTPPQDLFRQLYNSSHFYDQTFPTTEYGLVSIVPPTSDLPEGTRVIECDTYTAYDHGKWLSPEDANALIGSAYAEAEKSLCFTAKDCFLSVVEVAPNTYLATLIDPEERFPVGVKTALHIHMKGSFQCTDAITGQSLPVQDHRVSLNVAPGGFRILMLQGVPAQ